MVSQELLDKINEIYSADGTGENSKDNFTGMTLGIVVDTDDPLQNGRLRIFCPALNDNPKKIQHLPWAIYISPFGGSINNSQFARGNDPANCNTSGAVQYGFWGVPEQGAHVLVGCIDGDIRRRFYIGCAFEHQETHGILTNRWKHGPNGAVEGPYSSTDSPVQPAYDNAMKAFEDNTDSHEWKTRVVEYQVCAVREDVGQQPNSNKTTYLDQQNDKMREYEKYDWIKPILGSHGYDWTGFKSLGAFLSSRVYGYSTPGQHVLLMDDRPFNSRIKLKTTAGHQILMDDTNERIYINTAEGNSYIEMDNNGNIDVYTKRRLSFHAEKDINFSTDETFRVHAKKSINLYAGNNTEQEKLDGPPSDGQIRIHAEDDIHVITKKNYRQLSFEDTLIEIGGKLCESIGDSMYLQVQNEINIITNTGDYNLTVSGDINEMVQGNVNKFAAGSMKMASNGNAQVHSFDGKMDIGSQRTLNVKSFSEDITMESLGLNEDESGGVFIKSPQSQYGVSSDGVTTATNKKIRTHAAENIEFRQNVETNQDFPNLPPQDIGPCDLGTSIPTEGYTGADLAARLAYNAGFRGDALVTAVAIASAESSYNPDAVGDVSLQDEKWGPSVGLWQIRTLKNPSDYSGSVDEGRDINLIGGASNAQANANLAYQLSKGGTDFRPWSTFTANTYKNAQNLSSAQGAVNAMCTPEMMISNNEKLFSTVFDSPIVFSLLQNCLTNSIVAQGNAFIMSAEGVAMQSLADIKLKGETFSTKVFDEICEKINKMAFAHDLLSFFSATVFVGLAAGPATGAAAAATVLSQMNAILGIVNSILGSDPISLVGDLLLAELLNNLNLSFNISSIYSLDIPSFDSNVNTIYFRNNFDINASTILGAPASATLNGKIEFSLG